MDRDLALDLQKRLIDQFTVECAYQQKFSALRHILECIYKNLTLSSSVTFSGLFARMQFVHTEFNVPADLNTQVNLLRLKCNEVIHEDKAEVTDTDVYSAILVLCDLLRFVSAVEDHPALSDYLKQVQAQLYTVRKDNPKTDFSATVHDWKVVQDGNQRKLEIGALNELGIYCRIILYDDLKFDVPGRQWTHLARSLWQHCVIHFENLSVLAGKDHVYATNPETLVVLEPDFLIDVTGIADCFTSDTYYPQLFVLGKLTSEPSTDKMVQGKMVNAMLDELILRPKQEYNDLFRQCFAHHSISMVALGLETAKRIHETIKANHFPQITRFAASLSQDGVLIEPAFICPQYGLQGRLDILYLREGKHSIVELKSGKAKDNDIWIQNRMQVVGYYMMVRHVYGRQNLGHCSIFYSEDQDNPLRNVPIGIVNEQNLLMCRNRIIGLMRLLLTDTQAFFDWLKLSPVDYGTQFTNDKVNRVIECLRNCSEYEYEWLINQVRFAIREIWHVKIGSNDGRREGIYGFNGLWRLSVQDKINDYGIITGMRIVDWTQQSIRFTLKDSKNISNFRQGDLIVLYESSRQVDKQEILRGNIVAIDDRSVQINIRGGITNGYRLNSNSLWSIEPDILEAPLYAPLSGVISFLKTEESKRKLYFGIRQPDLETEDLEAEPSYDTSNIIRQIGNSKDYYLVQGPPGTGKTSELLSRYVQHLWQDTSKRLIILSSTNRAVDEICQNLFKHGIPYIRTGNSSFLSENVLNNITQGKRFNDISQILKDNRVWVSTVQSCLTWFNDLTSISQIDELIIDESSQIIESSILGIAAQIRKTILIGDLNQLPCIVVQSPLPYKFVSPVLQDLAFEAYNQSLFARLIRLCIRNNWHQSWSILTRHYRMHTQIADLISENYQNRLVCGSERQKEPLNRYNSDDPFLNNRIIWVDTPPAKTKHIDHQHIRLIDHILKVLANAGIISDPGTDLGIIAPFRTQINAIRNVTSETYPTLTIDTVERFQGSERSNIIFSIPLNHRNDIRLIESVSADGSIDCKLNVSVSRTRDRLIILANIGLCQQSPHYRKLIDKFQSNGIVIPIHQISM